MRDLTFEELKAAADRLARDAIADEERRGVIGGYPWSARIVTYPSPEDSTMKGNGMIDDDGLTDEQRLTRDLFDQFGRVTDLHPLQLGDMVKEHVEAHAVAGPEPLRGEWWMVGSRKCQVVGMVPPGVLGSALGNPLYVVVYERERPNSDLEFEALPADFMVRHVEWYPKPGDIVRLRVDNEFDGDKVMVLDGIGSDPVRLVVELAPGSESFQIATAQLERIDE